MRTRLIVLAAFLALLGLGGVAGVYFYDQCKQDLIAEGVKVNGVPIGGMTPRPGGAQALGRAARPARPAGEGPLQGPHVHAHAEGGGDRDRHPRLGRQGAAALAAGRHVLAHVAQRPQRVAEHRARGRGELQPARDRQARQARAQVDRPPAGGREGRPQRGQGRADAVPDRPARQVQHAGQAGRADPARSRQHRDGQGPDQGRPAEGLDQAARPEVSGGADRQPRRVQADALQEPQARPRPTGSRSARSGSRRPPASTTSRTRP